MLATLNLQVLAGNAGDPSLFMNLDDNSPNTPGSTVVVFTGTGTQTINLDPSALGDGYHGEGATCVPLDCMNNECPPGHLYRRRRHRRPPYAFAHPASSRQPQD